MRPKIALGLRRVIALGAALALGLATLPFSAGAQTAADCVDPTEPTPEINGPTDISAVSGNQNLTVAENSDGTITVMKWPSPSFYDQIKYRTVSRTQRRMGALPNEGAFLGLAYKLEGKDGWKFEWLRRWNTDQVFWSEDSDEIGLFHWGDHIGVDVWVSDVVAPDNDVLARRVEIFRGSSSRVTKVRIFSFANFNPVVSKSAQAPFDDWCTEGDNDDGALYAPNPDAVIALRSGLDASTGRESSVALAMGFNGKSDGHHVGADIYESPSGGTSAYDDSSDGRLSGGDSASGQADAAMFQEFSFTRARNKAATTVLFAAGRTRKAALNDLAAARSAGYKDIRRAKKTWWKAWLTGAVLPRGAPSSVEQLSKRALISLRQAIDDNTADVDSEGNVLPKGELIVESVSTQPPYGLDWVRNGAYFNYALELSGHPEIVGAHNFRYAILQNETGDSTRGGQPIPPGNWAMNYYADGVVGGAIPYEIDETGYGIWTLWEHYRFTKDKQYLNSDAIYEAIQRAAQYLTDTCRDPANGLQCVANEDDNANPSQTLKGAMLVWLGLDSAAKAARVRNTPESLVNAQLWAARRDEIEAAIEATFFDPDCSCYTEDFEDGGTLLWPVRFLDFDDPRARAQAEVNYDGIRPAFRGNDARGQYEAKAVLGNAYVWAGRPKKLARLKEGLIWLAKVATTDGTGLLGEAWMRFPDDDSKVVTMMGQPHVLQQTLFYLAALKVYGRAPYRFQNPIAGTHAAD